MEVTLDLILKTLKVWIANKTPIAPSTILEAAYKINMLLDDIRKELVEKEFELAQLTAEMALKSPEMPIARLKTLCATNPLNRDIGILKAKIISCVEAVRIAKQMSRMSIEELHNSNFNG